MSASSSSRRSSRSGAAGEGSSGSGVGSAEHHSRTATERREKAKSSQVYDERRRASLRPESRRGSVRPDDPVSAGGAGGLNSVPERPLLKGRTHSSPNVGTSRLLGGDVRRLRDEGDGVEVSASRVARGAAAGGEDTQAQDEDEVAGVVGPVRQYSSFQKPEVAEPLPEINIAVIGAEGVGKSTFVQQAFDLPFHPPSLAAEKQVPLDGNLYLVRLLELPIEDVDIDDDDNTISWPETIEDKMMPKVDGALTLYNVKDKTSLESIPEMLNAMNKAALPSVLVSCNCEAPLEERQVDPLLVENSAKRRVKNLSTIQTFADIPETPKTGVSMLLRAIVSEDTFPRIRSASAHRRAQSTTVRSVSPRPPSALGHARASSEYSGSLSKEQRRARHDSSLAGPYGTSDRLTVPYQRSQEDAHGSSWYEESASEASYSSRRSSGSNGPGPAPDVHSLAEKGGTLDELVDRLLAQPMSKADDKFVIIFLALYRKFAAPGMLLEAIAERFDVQGQHGGPELTRMATQVRYLGVVQQWISCYPGDFAYPKTRRRMRTFLAKISMQSIFAVAAKEIGAGLDLVQDDDDTNWAYCDKDREVTDYLRVSISSTASTLIDDPTSLFKDFSLGTPTSLQDDRSVTNSFDTTVSRSASSVVSAASSQHQISIDAARNQAHVLQPIPRQPLTKLQWRLLMDFPDETIAKELTKMDWVMFSAIRPRDLVRQVSQHQDPSSPPYKNLIYVERMIEHFNQLAFWVANYVLLRDKPKHRALMVEKMMRIARRLRSLNNYNALGAIIAGMKSSAVHRLAATRDLIPPGVGKDWLKLEILMSPTRSHFAYRLAWENSSAERIPYLPLLRRDLVSAEQGNRTFVGGDDRDPHARINWRKFEIMGEVVVGMHAALRTPYTELGGSINVAQSIKELILDVKLNRDEDELFERSKQVEPSPHTSVGTSTRIKEFFKR